MKWGRGLGVRWCSGFRGRSFGHGFYKAKSFRISRNSFRTNSLRIFCLARLFPEKVTVSFFPVQFCDKTVAMKKKDRGTEDFLTCKTSPCVVPLRRDPDS